RKAKKESDDDDEDSEEEKAAPSSQGDDDVKEESVKEEDEKEKNGKMQVDEALDKLDAEAAQLLTLLGGLCSRTYPRSTGDEVREKDKTKVDRQKGELREEMNKMQIVARAKVTTDRDILFFGDKHGQLGIWDPRALKTDDEDETADGQSWKLQVHWPATAKSSVSTVNAYDCTIRWTSFTSGVSKEVYAVEDTLISGFDFTSSGQEMYISDTKGGVTHLDLRASRHEARR
ncbi:13577_t:CDS:2, partial [Acaulospora colombiana]